MRNFHWRRWNEKLGVQRCGARAKPSCVDRAVRAQTVQQRPARWILGSFCADHLLMVGNGGGVQTQGKSRPTIRKISRLLLSEFYLRSPSQPSLSQIINVHTQEGSAFSACSPPRGELQPTTQPFRLLLAPQSMATAMRTTTTTTTANTAS